MKKFLSLLLLSCVALADPPVVIQFVPPLTRSGPNISIPAATDSVDGYLTKEDHALFATGGGGGLAIPVANNTPITFNSATSGTINALNVNGSDAIVIGPAGGAGAKFYTDGGTGGAAEVRCTTAHDNCEVDLMGNITYLFPSKDGSGTTGAQLAFTDPTFNYTVTLKAADDLAANPVFTLPSADGGMGDCMQTDGSGFLSFGSCGGGGSGVTTMAAVGASPSANGASISTTTLTLQPADFTHPGVLTSGTQNIGGAKTLNSDLTFDPSADVRIGTKNVTSGSGYNITLEGAGTTDPTGFGGSVNIFGGQVGTGIAGGDVNISSGPAAGSGGSAGDVNITANLGLGAGTNGKLVLNATSPSYIRVHGPIRINNGTEGTSGQTLRSIDVDGTVEFGTLADAGLASSYVYADGSRGLSADWNAGAHTITATTFSGALSGNATTSTTATNSTNTAITNDTTTNATMYPTWVTANTGNLPQKVSSTKLSFNPSTGTLTSTAFSGPLTGAVTGNADTATALAGNPTDCGADTYATTIAANGNLTCSTVSDVGLAVSYIKADGSRGLSADWNAGAHTITATTFSGALSGNATTATSATSATNATNTAVTDDTSTNATMYPTWVTTASGNQAQKVSSSKMTFNPSTGTLSSTIFGGQLNANANVILNSNYLSGDGGNEGLQVSSTGAVTVVQDSGTPTITAGLGSSAFSINGGNNSTSGSNTPGGIVYLNAGLGTGTGASEISLWAPLLKTSGSTAQDSLGRGLTVATNTTTTTKVQVNDTLWTPQICDAAGTNCKTVSSGWGTVTSVGMTVPSFLSISGSPVTSSGTLAVTLSGTALPIANGGSGQTTASAAFNALSTPGTSQIFTSTSTTSGYGFAIPSSTIGAGCVFSNNSHNFTVLKAIAPGTTVYTSGTGTLSGLVLTYVSGGAGCNGAANVTATASQALATYTTPANAKLIKVTVVGGGGGGGVGLACSSSGTSCGGGGAGGGTAIKYLTPGASYYYAVGTGGAGGSASPTSGVTGLLSIFDAASAQITGNGGAAVSTGDGCSTAQQYINGGVGGTATGGDINMQGGAGGIGQCNGATLTIGGFGGASFYGGSSQVTSNTGQAGATGSNYGGGGSGGGDHSVSLRAGGNGAPGIIVVEESY